VRRTFAVLALWLLLPACATLPDAVERLNDSAQETPLPRADFAALGLDAQGWQAMVDEVERRALPIDQMALLVDGQLLAEHHRNGHSARSVHDLRSATKSVTSLLVGVAIQQQRLRDADAPLAPLFAQEPALAGLTWRHLLAMRSGRDCNDWNAASPGNEERMYRSGDWLRFFFELPQRHEPGAVWSYCTAGLVLAGEALSRQVQQPLPVFAQQALFAPLGIGSARWQAAPKGVTDAGGHLRLTLSAMVKLGELMRQGGVWQGQRLVGADWVAQSLTPLSQIDPSGNSTRAWMGLAWWLEPVRDGRALSFQARGNGGQAIIVLPELGAVIAFTGHAYNADLATQLAPFDLVSRRLAPMLRERRQSQP
jgi:CubicO group peptidase (beta-lactamase class C family)